MFSFPLHLPMLQLTILACVLSPLLSLPLLYLLPRKIHSGLFVSGLSGLQAVFWLYVLPQVADAPISYSAATLFTLLDGCTLSIGYYLDEISVLMLLMVSVISCIVALYSMAYLPPHVSCKRYFGLCTLSLAAMYIILAIDQLWGMYCGWECLSITSCLLVSFWYQDPVATQAGAYTWLMNKVGSIAFLVGMVLMVVLYHHLSMPLLAAGSGSQHAVPYSYLVGCCFLIAGCAKAAQFPFFTWLPQAMAAPIPISALLHTATVLSAGVYLLVRTHPLFSTALHTCLVTIGFFTAFIGATTAFCRQHEGVKSILAYATLSQFGYIVAAIGLGEISAAIVYLLTHAFAKAFLFLLTGLASKLLKLKGYDNPEAAITMRCMGRVLKKCPLSILLFIFAMGGMGVIPGFLSFAAKERILVQTCEWAYVYLGRCGRYGILFLAFGSALVTLLYMLNAFASIFCHTERSYKIRTATFFKRYKNHGLMYSSMVLCSVCIVLASRVLKSSTDIVSNICLPQAVADAGLLMSGIVWAFLFYFSVGMIVRWLLPHAYDYKWIRWLLQIFWCFLGGKTYTPYRINFRYSKPYFYKTEAKRIEMDIWDYTISLSALRFLRMLIQGWYVDAFIRFVASRIAACSQCLYAMETRCLQQFLPQLTRATLAIAKAIHQLDQRVMGICVNSLFVCSQCIGRLYLRLQVERVQCYILWSSIGLFVLMLVWMLSLL